jgi:hypothetical protein
MSIVKYSGRNHRRKAAKVWTSYLSLSKSKPKITPYTEVIYVQISWLGIVNLFQTFVEIYNYVVRGTTRETAWRV